MDEFADAWLVELVDIRSFFCRFLRLARFSRALCFKTYLGLGRMLEFTLGNMPAKRHSSSEPLVVVESCITSELPDRSFSWSAGKSPVDIESKVPEPDTSAKKCMLAVHVLLLHLAFC